MEQMIESYEFDNKSITNKLFTTTELNLKSFFSRANKFPEDDTYFSLEEDSKETDIENDIFKILVNSNLKYINPILPLKEGEKIEEEFLYHYSNSTKDDNSKIEFISQKRKIFNINYRIRFDEFNDVQNKSLSPLSNEKSFLNNEILSTKKRRRENLDNIRKKIKTVFFNNYLYKKINEALKNKKSKLYFVKFPISFVNDIKRNTNKDIINKSLLEIMLNKGLYNENDLDNYYHNLKVVGNKEILENEELKAILNKKYCELFEEYINSKEFNINEINRLKNNNMEDVYIKKYIYQSKYFMEYFME
jgi:hypothetical protein